jgi:hypothetical protein
MTETMSRPLQSASSVGVDELNVSIDRLRDGVTDADRRLRQFVEAQPLTALLGAVVAGYIAARVFRRL